MTIMANEVKTKGVSIFDTVLEKFSEVIISVRGKKQYCVIPYEEYEDFRAYQLDKAHQEVMDDIAKNKYHTSTSAHLEKIKKALDDV